MSDVRPGVSVPPPVSAAQRSVLYAVRRRGEATVADIAAMLDMTSSGARQHLAGLVDAGLLDIGQATRTAGQQGRSERTYSIAAAAETLFPQAYGELTNQLLGYVPAGAVTAAFEHRRDDRIDGARARLATKRGFAAKVTELARILDEDGYLAAVEPIGRDAFRIAERNCAIFAVAREHPQACSTELEFLRAALPEADIERVTHMMAGVALVQLRGPQAPRPEGFSGDLCPLSGHNCCQKRDQSRESRWSPAETLSPSATAMVATTPAWGASSGNSIFIDSRMSSCWPSATSSPTADVSFQMLPVTGEGISVTAASYQVSM